MTLVNKYFLDFPGLAEYDRLIKEYIKTGSTDEIEKILHISFEDLKKREKREKIKEALEMAIAVFDDEDY